MHACPQTQAQICNFLDDLLSEQDRARVRSHLDYCNECRIYISRQDHWSADLKALNSCEVPFDLASAIKESLLAPQKKSSPLMKRNPLLTGFLTVLFVLAGVFYLILQRKSPVRVTAPVQAPAAEALPAVPEAEKESRAARIRVSLEPLQWDLFFKDSAAHSAFLRELEAKKWKQEFLSREAAVFSLERPELAELVLLIREKLAVYPKGVFGSKELIPEFEGPVRVTLMLRVHGDKKGIARYLNLKFMLPNIFVLQQQLESEKIHFVYASSQLWVLEIPRNAYENLKAGIRATPGLVLSEETVPETDEKGGELRVFAVLDTG